MLEFKNVEVAFLDKSIKASGYPTRYGEVDKDLNDSDYKRATKLGKMSGGHDNFLKGIRVNFDVKYSAYWSMQAQRYSFFDIVSSQSKMIKIIDMANELDSVNMFNKYVDTEIIDKIINYIDLYMKADTKESKYHYFMKIISNLPMGFEMWMNVSTNYMQLKTMYSQRSKHKLKEDWGNFITMCNELPRFKELTGL